MSLCWQRGLRKGKFVSTNKVLSKHLLTMLLAISFGRCYVNLDAREAYFQLFKTFFELVNIYLRPSKRFLGWHYIHGFGLKAVVADMCSKQALGM